MKSFCISFDFDCSPYPCYIILSGAIVVLCGHNSSLDVTKEIFRGSRGGPEAGSFLQGGDDKSE